MPRKATPQREIGPDWFLQEWMHTLHVTQAELGRRCDWSKATANDIFHGKTEYYRVILNRVAAALHIQPWELLMPPAEAMALRRLRGAALTIAAEERASFTPAPEEAERLLPRRQN